jgi:hypothetical protein
VMDIPVRMRQIRTNNQNGESQIGLARQARSTRSAPSYTMTKVYISPYIAANNDLHHSERIRLHLS